MKIAQLHEQIEQMAEKQKVKVYSYCFAIAMAVPLNEMNVLLECVIVHSYTIILLVILTQYDCEEFEVMVQEEREKCQRQLEVTRELVNTIAAQVCVHYYVST